MKDKVAEAHFFRENVAQISEQGWRALLQKSITGFMGGMHEFRAAGLQHDRNVGNRVANHARQLEARTEGTDFQAEMSRLATDIEADLEKLTDLMERIGASRNPAKQIATWAAEKASRLKLAGVSSGNGELGTFLSIEALSLGVEGKASLWTTLIELRGDYPNGDRQDRHCIARDPVRFRPGSAEFRFNHSPFLVPIG